MLTFQSENGMAMSGTQFSSVRSYAIPERVRLFKPRADRKMTPVGGGDLRFMTSGPGRQGELLKGSCAGSIAVSGDNSRSKPSEKAGAAMDGLYSVKRRSN